VKSKRQAERALPATAKSLSTAFDYRLNAFAVFKSAEG
jgi:hypothetical protein